MLGGEDVINECGGGEKEKRELEIQKISFGNMGQVHEMIVGESGGDCQGGGGGVIWKL